MTAQTPERLIYQGETLTLCNEPLGQLHQLLANKSWHFYPADESLRRGYVGTWSIEGDRLYLVKFFARVRQRPIFKSIALEDLFPDYPNGVFAHWFTGELRCPLSGFLNFEDGGFGNASEEDLFLHVNRGVVVGARRVGKVVPTHGVREGAMSTSTSDA